MTQHPVRIGIDASNIRFGGGLTHLGQLLAAADPQAAGVGEIHVWAGRGTLDALPVRPWLHRHHQPALDRALPRRLVWQQVRLPAAARAARCDVLFSPGGLLPLRPGLPTVTMSQNMLPFEPAEAARFGRPSRLWLKMQLLRVGQSRSMRQADGVIFLTRYARDHVLAALGGKVDDTVIIPHGLEPRFFLPPRPAVAPGDLSESRPFRLLYVSIVELYKHQWQLVHAVGRLRQDGVPVRLDLIGPPTPFALARLEDAIAQVDPHGTFITYHGGVPFADLHAAYHRSDAFAFASSCENLPNIMLEAMAAGLPIASSAMGPMPEVLDGAGLLFDPLDVASIVATLRELIAGRDLRERLARQAHARAQAFTWDACAADTLRFCAKIARRPAGARR